MTPSGVSSNTSLGGANWRESEEDNITPTLMKKSLSTPALNWFLGSSTASTGIHSQYAVMPQVSQYSQLNEEENEEEDEDEEESEDGGDSY